MAINLNYLKTRVVLYPILGAATMVALIAAGFDVGLSKSDWASWVQAIGSIAAIGVAFAVANRQQRAVSQEKRSTDLRRIQSIRALYQNVLDMTVHAQTALNEQNGDRLGPQPWKHLNERKMAIQRLSIFDVPDAKIAVAIIPMPISIERLCDGLSLLWHQAEEPPPIEHPVDDEVDAALGVVITRAKETLMLCDLYITEHTSR